MAKPASITGNLVARKGDASPIHIETQSAPAESPIQKVSPKRKLISMSVKLNENQYRAIKLYGIDHKLSFQDVCVQALKAYTKMPS